MRSETWTKFLAWEAVQNANIKAHRAGVKKQAKVDKEALVRRGKEDQEAAEYVIVLRSVENAITLSQVAWEKYIDSDETDLKARDDALTRATTAISKHLPKLKDEDQALGEKLKANLAERKKHVKDKKDSDKRAAKASTSTSSLAPVPPPPSLAPPPPVAALTRAKKRMVAKERRKATKEAERKTSLVQQEEEHLSIALETSRVEAFAGFEPPTLAALAGPSTAPPESTIGASRCIVCMEDDKDHLFLPCKHVLCCASCAEKIMHTNKMCPMCRTPIECIIGGLKGL